MTDDTDPVAKHLGDAMQSVPSVDDEMPEGALCTGWVAVVEWRTPDGEEWLTRFSADINGERLSEWRRDGFLHNALNGGSWGSPYDDDE